MINETIRPHTPSSSEFVAAYNATLRRAAAVNNVVATAWAEKIMTQVMSGKISEYDGCDRLSDVRRYISTFKEVFVTPVLPSDGLTHSGLEKLVTIVKTLASEMQDTSAMADAYTIKQAAESGEYTLDIAGEHLLGLHAKLILTAGKNPITAKAA